MSIIISILGGAAAGVLLQSWRTSRATGVPMVQALRARRGGGPGEE